MLNSKSETGVARACHRVSPCRASRRRHLDLVWRARTACDVWGVCVLSSRSRAFVVGSPPDLFVVGENKGGGADH